MKPNRKSFISVLFFALIISAPVALRAQQANPPATVPVRMVVTVLGHNFSTPPAVSREDVRVYEGRDQLTIAEWTPARDKQAGLDFAILIDETSTSNLGLQLNDLSDFIRELPASARVGVFYTSNGGVQIASDFTPDHAAAAKALRLPLGIGGAFSSPYLSLMDLLKRWPETGNRREVLLVSSGIDRFRGDYPTSTDLLSAIEQAQRNGIMIHTIYAAGVGRAARNLFRINLAQGNLAQIADATGGEAFFQGSYTPIDYAPYLKELEIVLNNQYLLTFLAKPGKKSELRRFHVTTEVQGVELSAPSNALVPAGQ